MILTKEMAEKAKTFIGGDYKMGVCGAIRYASKLKIYLHDHEPSFWKGADLPDNLMYKRERTPEGDIKRRAFIDSLIGKDL